MAIPAEIQALATKVRNEVYGRDVREAIAKSIEETGKTAAEAYEITQNLIDGTFDEGILSTQIEQKLLDLEAQYAPQLTSLTAELAEKAEESDLIVERERINNLLVQPPSVDNAETADIRVGGNGITYGSAGESVRAQFNILATNVNDIFYTGLIGIEPTYTSGGYVNNVQKNITTLAGFSYSQLIELKKGESLKVSGKSTASGVVDMISRWSSGGAYVSSIYAYQSTGVLETYEYTATYDVEYVRVCYANSFAKPIVKKGFISLSESNEKIVSLQDDISGLRETSIHLENSIANITKIQGAYCNALYKNITSVNGYFYTEIYQLNKGDVVSITSKDDSGTAVARISRWTSDGNTMLEVIATGTTTMTTVSYTAVEEVEYLRFSGQTVNNFDVKLKEVTVSSIFESSVKSIVGSNVMTSEKVSVAMFEKIALCGDSYVKGQIYGSSGVIGDRPNLSWGKVLGRLNGIDASVYASSGADTNTWQTRSDCLPLALSSPPSGLYVFSMGINDYSYVTLGTLADITSHANYADYPNTFYGNYGAIIEQIMSHAPNSKIILMPPFFKVDSVYYNYCIDALREITNHYNIPLIDTIDSELANSSFFMDNMVGGHPTAPLYSAMGKEMTKLIDKCIYENYNYFKGYAGL